MCGWLRDRVGASWQITPAILGALAERYGGQTDDTNPAPWRRAGDLVDPGDGRGRGGRAIARGGRLRAGGSAAGPDEPRGESWPSGTDVEPGRSHRTGNRARRSPMGPANRLRRPGSERGRRERAA